MSKIVLFKTNDGREVTNPGEEIVRLAHEKQAACPTLTFAAARDLVLRAEPVLARGWLRNGEED